MTAQYDDDDSYSGSSYSDSEYSGSSGSSDYSDDDSGSENMASGGAPPAPSNSRNGFLAAAASGGPQAQPVSFKPPSHATAREAAMPDFLRQALAAGGNPEPPHSSSVEAAPPPQSPPAKKSVAAPPVSPVTSNSPTSVAASPTKAVASEKMVDTSSYSDSSDDNDSSEEEEDFFHPSQFGVENPAKYLMQQQEEASESTDSEDDESSEEDFFAPSQFGVENPAKYMLQDPSPAPAEQPKKVPPQVPSTPVEFTKEPTADVVSDAYSSDEDTSSEEEDYFSPSAYGFENPAKYSLQQQQQEDGSSSKASESSYDSSSEEEDFFSPSMFGVENPAKRFIREQTEPTHQESSTHFIPAPKFIGSKPGYVFKMGDQGVGYYVDAKSTVHIAHEAKETSHEDSNGSSTDSRSASESEESDDSEEEEDYFSPKLYGVENPAKNILQDDDQTKDKQGLKDFMRKDLSSPVPQSATSSTASSDSECSSEEEEDYFKTFGYENPAKKEQFVPAQVVTTSSDIPSQKSQTSPRSNRVMGEIRDFATAIIGELGSTRTDVKHLQEGMVKLDKRICGLEESRRSSPQKDEASDGTLVKALKDRVEKLESYTSSLKAELVTVSKSYKEQKAALEEKVALSERLLSEKTRTVESLEAELKAEHKALDFISSKWGSTEEVFKKACLELESARSQLEKVQTTGVPVQVASNVPKSADPPKAFSMKSPGPISKTLGVSKREHSKSPDPSTPDNGLKTQRISRSSKSPDPSTPDNGMKTQRISRAEFLKNKIRQRRSNSIGNEEEVNASPNQVVVSEKDFPADEPVRRGPKRTSSFGSFASFEKQAKRPSGSHASEGSSLSSEGSFADDMEETTSKALLFSEMEDGKLKRLATKLQKKLNHDPWDANMKFDDKDLLFFIEKHPQTCCVKFTFDKFTGMIFPLSILVTLKASIETVQAAFKAYPPAIEDCDAWVGSPLHYAVSYKADWKIVQLLVDEYPPALEQVNSFDRTPLHLACVFSAHYKVVSLVLNKYPKAASMMDKDGNTPLSLATEFNASRNILELLQEATPSRTLLSPKGKKKKAVKSKLADDSSAHKLSNMLGLPPGLLSKSNHLSHSSPKSNLSPEQKAAKKAQIAKLVADAKKEGDKSRMTSNDGDSGWNDVLSKPPVTSQKVNNTADTTLKRAVRRASLNAEDELVDTTKNDSVGGHSDDSDVDSEYSSSGESGDSGESSQSAYETADGGEELISEEATDDVAEASPKPVSEVLEPHAIASPNQKEKEPVEVESSSAIPMVIFSPKPSNDFEAAEEDATAPEPPSSSSSNQIPQVVYSPKQDNKAEGLDSAVQDNADDENDTSNGSNEDRSSIASDVQLDSGSVASDGKDDSNQDPDGLTAKVAEPEPEPEVLLSPTMETILIKVQPVDSVARGLPTVETSVTAVEVAYGLHKAIPSRSMEPIPVTQEKDEEPSKAPHPSQVDQAEASDASDDSSASSGQDESSINTGAQDETSATELIQEKAKNNEGSKSTGTEEGQDVSEEEREVSRSTTEVSHTAEEEGSAGSVNAEPSPDKPNESGVMQSPILSIPVVGSLFKLAASVPLPFSPLQQGPQEDGSEMIPRTTVDIQEEQTSERNDSPESENEAEAHNSESSDDGPIEEQAASVEDGSSNPPHETNEEYGTQIEKQVASAGKEEAGDESATPSQTEVEEQAKGKAEAGEAISKEVDGVFPQEEEPAASPVDSNGTDENASPDHPVKAPRTEDEEPALPAATSDKGATPGPVEAPEDEEPAVPLVPDEPATEAAASDEGASPDHPVEAPQTEEEEPAVSLLQVDPESEAATSDEGASAGPMEASQAEDKGPADPVVQDESESEAATSDKDASPDHPVEAPEDEEPAVPLVQVEPESEAATCDEGASPDHPVEASQAEEEEPAVPLVQDEPESEAATSDEGASAGPVEASQAEDEEPAVPLVPDEPATEVAASDEGVAPPSSEECPAGSQDVDHPSVSGNKGVVVEEPVVPTTDVIEVSKEVPAVPLEVNDVSAVPTGTGVRDSSQPLEHANADTSEIDADDWVKLNANPTDSSNGDASNPQLSPISKASSTDENLDENDQAAVKEPNSFIDGPPKDFVEPDDATTSVLSCSTTASLAEANARLEGEIQELQEQFNAVNEMLAKLMAQKNILEQEQDRAASTPQPRECTPMQTESSSSTTFGKQDISVRRIDFEEVPNVDSVDNNYVDSSRKRRFLRTAITFLIMLAASLMTRGEYLVTMQSSLTSFLVRDQSPSQPLLNVDVVETTSEGDDLEQAGAEAGAATAADLVAELAFFEDPLMVEQEESSPKKKQKFLEKFRFKRKGKKGNQSPEE